MNTSRVFIMIGSNIEPEQHLLDAAHRLADRFAVKAVSRVYESPPINAEGKTDPNQDPFLNAALLIESDLSPASLKFEVLRPLEGDLGRVRSADKFAPRTIDLDIALYDDRVIEDEANDITVPDPNITRHAHVALPLADLDPDYVHPVSGETLDAIAAPFRADNTLTVREDVDLSACLT